MVELHIYFQEGVDLSIVSIQRASSVDCVCHGWEEAEEDFFLYMQPSF